jgi:hypothetical protein
MSSIREGGCQCGGIRYGLTTEPLTLAICHCKECQRQSGSAFGMSLMMPAAGFELLSGRLKSFERATASGRTLVCSFCPDCGTRIHHTPQYAEGVINVKAGTLDDTSWLEPKVSVWMKSKQPWLPLPDGMMTFESQP